MTSLYVHVPFCARKCPYCAFESAPISSGDEETYIAALDAEARARSDAAPTTIYIGGGTPSVLSIDSWKHLFDIIERNFSLRRCVEFTVEANPGSLTDEHISLWRSRGVTRVSIGVQSFDDGELARLGRAHGASEAERAVRACVAAGSSVSIDLIFGTDGRPLRAWCEDLRRAVSLSPDHISVYQLTIEPDTPFARDGVTAAEGYGEYRYAQWYLPRKGYEQYEVASFARAGRESRHNINYWNEGEYVGIGPGAWSFVDGTRCKNAWPMREWADAVMRGASPICRSERLDGESAARESAILALRTARGMDIALSAARYGREITERILDELRAFGSDIVVIDGERARLTKHGMRVGSAVWREIAPSCDDRESDGVS